MIKKHTKKIGTSIPNLDQLSIDQQYNWMNEYKIDTLELGMLCTEFPALKNSWNQFKTVYKMCKVEHEANEIVPKLAR